MINIKIHVDIRPVEQALEGMIRELPYVVAVGLTKLAQAAQQDVIQETKKRFTIRRPWIEKGKYAVRIVPANKRTLTASVWNDAPWITGHEEGEVRTPDGKYFAVPTGEVKRNKRDLITASNKPKGLKNSFVIHDNNKAFIVIRKKKGKRKAGSKIAPLNKQIVRTGKGKKRISNDSKMNVRILYNLTTKAKIKPAWGFVDTVARSVERNYKRVYNEVLAKI